MRLGLGLGLNQAMFAAAIGLMASIAAAAVPVRLLAAAAVTGIAAVSLSAAALADARMLVTWGAPVRGRYGTPEAGTRTAHVQ